jgi:protein-disulfide isomerase
MTLKTGLLAALVAAVVAAVVTATSIYFVLWRGAPGGVLATLEQAKIEQVVREYLTRNPEILVEMTTELDNRQQAAEAAKQQRLIGEHAEQIYRSPTSFVAGDPDGDVTVVEFFDYNCGYCRRALPALVELIDNDDKVRVVLKELPIFGDDSEDAAKAALAADKQGKYFEMHLKLFSDPGKANKEKALKIAEELDMDVAQLETDMEDPEIQKSLDESRALAEKIGVEGTPFYLIGDRSLAGAPDDLYDQLTETVAVIREKGCETTC